ncbi:MAG: YigZ family protein [Candidatus Fermentibacteraceae bacterium]
MAAEPLITLETAVCGKPILEKQSRFLACGVPLSGKDAVTATVQAAAKRFRMEKASQLSWACRLADGSEFKNDGGEPGAGRCILEVMNGMNAVDCVVIVGRWYGGKHLGGMRFRIYREAARKLLAEQGTGKVVRDAFMHRS